MSHGGAFKVFKGLSMPDKKYQYSSVPYQGLPCLHTKHKGQTVWRDGRSHACQLCKQDIADGSLGFSLDRLSHEAQLKARRFWSKVAFGSLDDCWQWKAPPIGSYIAFTWDRRPIRKRFIFHVIHVATWLTWGDIGRGETISLCGQRRCVNPLHNIPASIAGTDVLNHLDREYLSSDYKLMLSQLNTEYDELLDSDCEEVSNPLGFEHRILRTLPHPMDDFTSIYEKALFERDESLANGTHHLFNSD